MWALMHVVYDTESAELAGSCSPLLHSCIDALLHVLCRANALPPVSDTDSKCVTQLLPSSVCMICQHRQYVLVTIPGFETGGCILLSSACRSQMTAGHLLPS
jgi:hypothetical protein